MKHIKTNTLMAMAVVSVAMLGCNPLNKMNKKHGMVKYDLNPNPLEMHNDSVAMTVSGRYPAKFFHKKAVATITPVMKDITSGNVVKQFDPIQLVGESATGEGTKINYSGGSFSMSKTVPYEPSMENVELQVLVEAGYKDKTKTFDPVTIGYGTITTPSWVQSDDMAILGKDNFTKTSPRTITGEIQYLINSAHVRPAQLQEDDIKAVRAFLDKGNEFEYTYKNVVVKAYASPDGEITLNENLAEDRARTARDAFKSLFRSKKANAGTKDELYNLQPQGEDWEGFKQKMQASNIEDKDMILRILTMYEDKQKREQEIKNLAATYTVIAEEILPPLRRSVVTINAEEKAKTDEELMALVKTSPAELTNEEILYVATLYNDPNQKLEVYKISEQTFPEDWRGASNVGYIYIQQNKVNDAKAQFDKAAQIDPNAKVVLNNQGVVFRLMGDEDKAKEYFEKAKGAGPEVNYNLAILNIREGNYVDAVSNSKGNNTFNAALAQYLNKDYEGALNTIEASDAKATAEGYYLKALIGAKTNNKEMMLNNLRAAGEKDATFKDKARVDMEFKDFREDADFKAAL